MSQHAPIPEPLAYPRQFAFRVANEAEFNPGGTFTIVQRPEGQIPQGYLIIAQHSNSEEIAVLHDGPSLEAASRQFLHQAALLHVRVAERVQSWAAMGLTHGMTPEQFSRQEFDMTLYLIERYADDPVLTDDNSLTIAYISVRDTATLLIAENQPNNGNRLH